jgi:hypothetical protein
MARTMTLACLSEFDRDRAEKTSDKLAHHDISRWALTGGLATELHIVRHTGKSVLRSLNDLDFLVSSFDCIPTSLAREFLLRHVHPDDPPGKTLLQCVDPETGIRIDVFRAYGSVMERLAAVDLIAGLSGVISLEDLTARAARLCWDLAGNGFVAPKYTRDFLRLLDLVKTHDVEPVWQEHRKPHSPESFSVAAEEIRRLITARPELIISPVYCTDVAARCERCRETPALPLADPSRVLAILGYC